MFRPNHAIQTAFRYARGNLSTTIGEINQKCGGANGEHWK